MLWSCIGAKGSAHDSSVFKGSGLYEYLMSIANELYDNGMYIMGDSAYALRGYVIYPYDKAKKRSIEDNFSFFQSS